MDAADPFEHCTPSSPKLLEIYNKKKQPGDPEMPCLQDPCPCWTVEELSSLRYTWDVQGCVSGMHPVTGMDENSWYLREEPYYGDLVSVVATQQFGTLLCLFKDTCSDGTCSNVSRYHVLTLEEHAICTQQARWSGTERGFDCFD
jgi:hypothetical protein